MADNTTTTTPAGTTPATGGIDYAEYQKKIQEAAARTRSVQGTTPEQEQTMANIATRTKNAYRVGADIGSLGTVSQGLVQNFQQQKTDVQKQAERAASALEMVGSSTLQGVQNLENVQGTIRNQVSSAKDSFSAAAEKADEYVKAARGRVSEVLSKLDNLFTDIQTTRDFSKAHAVQASVQAVTGSMKAEERNIIENYGTDSKEYAQFRQSKMGALATVQSNIHASYAQLEEQQKTNYLNAVSDAYTKSNMYLGFQEQQHVEMLKYQDDSRAAYALKGAELDATIEQMKMSGMENLANWIVETPTFTMDATPLLTTLATLGQTAESLAYAKSEGRGGGGGGFDWGSIAGTAIGAGLGAVTGGIGTPVGAAIGQKVGSSINPKTKY